MRVPIDSFRDLRHSTLLLILLLAFAGIAGCGSGHSSGGLSSPPDWVVVPSGGLHAKSATLSYIANGGISDCAECHGADLSGGTSKVSCFGNPAGCHHGSVSGWDTAAVHGASAKKAPGNSGFAACQVCHGADFTGGGSQVSCFPCHGVSGPHSPKPWRSGTGGATHTSTDPENAAVCIQCHFPGSPNNPAGHPSTPAPAGTPPGCYNNTLCHGAGGAPHAVPFPGTTHTAASQTSFTADCSPCHAVTGISPVSTAPPCSVCHEAGSPLTNANCSSCHGNPPAGTTYPNVAGTHARHDALASVTGVCPACHTNLGSGTMAHYDRANARPGKNALRVPPGDVAFPVTWNAKAGSAAFSGTDLTCANVSCHGAVTAPNWQTGRISGNTDVGCRQCHKIGTAPGVPENNSPFSGLHTLHLSTSVGGLILCTDCHNMANGTAGAANHYKFLDTASMEGPAKDTLEPNGTAANYNASNQTCGTFTCHTVAHSSFPWNGGASHPVPFTGMAHTSVTAGTFAANCGACHFETGPATKIGPTCTTCHQAASPLAATGCAPCHANPPSGTEYPNVAGKHAVHGALPGVGACNPCHNGLDTGTLEHYNRANALPGKDALRVAPGDIAFLTNYNAKSGTASFTAANRTCSNVICHGGQAAPDWQTATADAIDVPNACLACHVSGTTQYNSYYSGNHASHIDNVFGLSATTCKLCHDEAKVNVSGHFQNLATSVFEQRPKDTILPAVQYNKGACNPQEGGLTGCHGSRKW